MATARARAPVRTRSLSELALDSERRAPEMESFLRGLSSVIFRLRRV